MLLDLVALQSKNESMFVNVSWNMLHNTICPHYNWTMVNIHSQREQDFIGYFLHHKLQGGSGRDMDSKSDKFDYAYLGMLNTGAVKRLYLRIYHDCEVRIKKIVPRIAVWHHKACQVMTNCDPKGRIFLSYPHTNNGFFFLVYHCSSLFIYLLTYFKKASRSP